MGNKKTQRVKNLTILFLVLFACGVVYPANAEPKIAVLDFELKDLTLLPGIPEEVERTASVKPMLEEELAKSGFEIVHIPLEAQAKAAPGFGYLFDHHDLAAELAKEYGADYIIVGRLHKPSYLFIYLMAHLVDAKHELLVADYLSEVKGGHKKLTRKGVEDLAVKINETFKTLE